MTKPQKKDKEDRARRVAADCLDAVMRKRQLLDQVFPAAADGAALNADGRAFANQVVMTSCRYLGFLRAVLADFLDKPIAPKARYAETVMLTALAQILAMRTADHGVVDATVTLIRSDNRTQHLTGLVNAVLRRAIRERGTLVAQLAAKPPQVLPDWIAARWTAHHGADRCDALAAALAHQPPTDIQLKPGIDITPYTDLGGLPVADDTIRFARVDVPSLPGYESGDFWVQDLAASWPVRLLGDVQGLRVLDLCAAPGGKTMQLAAKGAVVTALDRSAPRMQTLTENLDRTCLAAEVVVADALTYGPHTGGPLVQRSGQESGGNAVFDAVIVDAPCSATGTYRRHPDVLWTKTEADITKLADLQRRLLDHALGLVKPGGAVLYCTCSLEPEEGEDQIAALLDCNSGVRRVDISADDLPPGGQITAAGDMRLGPMAGTADGGMDGFFAARLVRA